MVCQIWNYIHRRRRFKQGLRGSHAKTRGMVRGMVLGVVEWLQNYSTKVELKQFRPLSRDHFRFKCVTFCNN